MGLPLFVVIRPDGKPDYDTMKSAVIAARSHIDARKLASQNAGDEGGDAWMDGAKSTCRRIAKQSIYHEPSVIARDFTAG
mgnify:CR=1 FL=1